MLFIPSSSVLWRPAGKQLVSSPPEGMAARAEQKEQLPDSANRGTAERAAVEARCDGRPPSPALRARGSRHEP